MTAPRRDCRALDLCAGAGGLSLGLQRAGFDVLGVELDADAVATHRANVGPCDHADIASYHPAGRFDLVGGGVPCQSFSNAGQRAGFRDPRGRLLYELLRIAGEAESRCVLLENVRGFKRLALPVLLAAVREAGYEPRWTMLNAADYGVPQRRERFFLVGFRDADDAARFRWPAPTHGAPGNLFGLPPWVTVRESLGLSGAFRAGQLGGRGWQGMRGLDVDAPGYAVSARNNADLLSPLDAPACTVGAGGTDGGGGAGLLDRPATTIMGSGEVAPAGHHDRVRTQTVTPLDASGLLDRPATTVDTTNGLQPAGNHARQKRAVRLTLAQVAALQGYPPGFVFHGATVGSHYRQNGNSVCPAVGEAIGRAIHAVLTASRRRAA